MQAPFPLDEADRLEVLCQGGVLDTESEQAFDDLTHLAAQICDTPLAAITLVAEDRQWFKSRFGLTASETHRDLSFCAHTILQDDILVVPDASADARFADNSFVTAEPHIRFYAGVPLVTPQGQAVGTLCVLDTVPRRLDQAQQESLRRLARQALALLEARPDATTEIGQGRQTRRQSERQRLMLAQETAHQDMGNLKFSETRYRRLFESAKDGILILDAESGKIEDVNPYLCELLGYERDDFLGEQLWNIGTFRDIAANQDAFRTLQEKEYIRYDDLPLETKNGQIASVEFVSNVYVCGDKKVIQCNIRDISGRKSAYAVSNRLAAIVEFSDDGIISKDLDGIINTWNAGAQALYGYTAQEMIGRSISVLVPPDMPDEMPQLLEKIRRGESVEHYETVRVTKNGTRKDVSISISPLRDAQGNIIGASSIKRDISGRKQASEAERESQHFLQSTLDALASHVAVLDENGKIIAVNKAWRQFSEENDGTAASCGVGAQYLAVCDKARGAWKEEAPIIAEGIREVIAAAAQHEAFCLEYPCHSPEEERWFNVCVTRFAGEGPVRVVVAHENITQRKQAEALLLRSETRFRMAISEAPVPIIIHREDGKVLQLSKGWTRYSGYTIEDIPTMRAWTERAFGKSSVQAQERINRLYELKETQEGGEQAITSKSGEERIWDFRSTPLGTFDDNQRVVVSAALDVTERKRAEDTIRAAEERFQSMMANTPGTVYQFVCRPDGSVEIPFVNEGCRELFEMDPEELQRNPTFPIEIIHPDDLPQHEYSVRQSMKTLTSWSSEWRIRLPSGKTKWVQGAVRPQRLPDGGTLWDGLLMDITTRKEAEEERDRFFTLSLDMLAIIGSDGYIKRLNPAFEATLGFSDAELTAVPFLEFVHPDDHAATLAEMARVNSGATAIRFENRYRCRDGSYKWMRWMAAPFEDLWYCVAHDITGVKKTAAALIKANDELELRVMERTAELEVSNREMYAAKQEADAANLAKSEFLSRMSHELRTPLNAILGFGQILDKQDQAPVSKESIGYILKGGRHLLDLVNEVLDIARVEAGHLELSLEPVAINDVVPEACALVRPLAVERNIRLDQNTSELGRHHILADRQRLGQVLINVLANAIKYNREGGQVEVLCSQRPDGWTSIAVRDTGAGISPEDLPKIFTPFERLNASSSDIEGTGLGLVLSQRLMRAMGGTLSVESTLGRGTTFTVGLPDAVSPEERLAETGHEVLSTDAAPEAEGAYSVLCIEDNPSNLRLMEVILAGRPDISLLAAMQGSIGLDLARQHEPDLILLDLNLPDIRGSEVLTRLQQSAITRDIPVVVVSADATPNQVERLLAAGAKAYLTKPLDVAGFLRTLDEFLQP